MSIPKKKSGLMNVLILLLAILLVLLLLAAGILTYVFAKLDLIQYDNEIDKTPYESTGTYAPGGTEEDGNIVDISDLETVETAPPIPDSDAVGQEGVLNILLIGTDERSNDFSVDARSDSMILVSIDRGKNTVKLVSLERGMGVPVLEGPYQGQYDWLTHIFRYGGADLLVETVEYCFKVEIDNYVRLNFNSVRQIVDSLGGIDMELTGVEAVALNLEKGMNHLDGANALRFARLRKIDSDWQRVERQRKVILAVVDALRGSDLIQLNALADSVLPMIQTDMTKIEIAELMLYSPNFLNSRFDQMTIPKEGTYGGMIGMGGRGLFAVDFETNNQILHDFLYGEEK